MPSPHVTPSAKGSPRFPKWASAIAITLGLIVVKTFFEHTEFVQYWEDKTYQVLQGRIVSQGTTTQPDVLVVDISKVEPEPWERDGRTGLATPRHLLKELIEVFTDLGARSVGVDVDFSPTDGQPVHPDDPEFFQWCLDRSRQTHIPILLGVFRTAGDSYEWLGDDRYLRLAAFIGSREPDRTIYSIKTKNGLPLRSMSAGLAGLDWDTSRLYKDSFLNWFFEPTSITDFSRLDRMRDEVFHSLDPQFFRDERVKIENRMILIGDAPSQKSVALQKKDRDLFRVTGVPDKVPGVFLHACGASSIAANRPILQLTLLGRLVVDTVLAAFIYAAVQLSLYLRTRSSYPPGHAIECWLNILFTLLTICFAFIVSVGLVRLTRLLWIDFIFACAVLLVQLIVDLIRSPNDALPEIDTSQSPI